MTSACVNLYRGKRKDNGEWVYGLLWKKKFNTSKLFIHFFPYEDDDDDYVVIYPETVGQATGFKNLFTGDIVTEEFDGAVGVVCFGIYKNPFNDGTSGFHVGIYIDWKGKYNDLLRKDFGYWMSRDDVKLIGNIHDNPELLEVECR